MSVGVGTKLKSGGVALLLASGIVWVMGKNSSPVPSRGDSGISAPNTRRKPKSSGDVDKVHKVEFYAHWSPQGRPVDITTTVGATDTKFRYTYSPHKRRNNARSGDHVGLLVEATSTGGNVQCVIYVDGLLAALKKRENDAGDCYVTYVIP